jgi:hypothetical protein
MVSILASRAKLLGATMEYRAAEFLWPYRDYTIKGQVHHSSITVTIGAYNEDEDEFIPRLGSLSRKRSEGSIINLARALISEAETTIDRAISAGYHPR